MVESTMAEVDVAVPEKDDLKSNKEQPLWIVKLIIKRPATMSWCICLVTLCMLIAIILAIMIPGDDLFNDSGPQSDRNDIRSRQYEAYTAAKTFTKYDDMGEEMRFKCGWSGSSLCNPLKVRKQSVVRDVLLVVYESKSNNVLTDEGTKLFEQFHNKITTNEDFPKFCVNFLENECDLGMTPSDMFKSNIGDTRIDYNAWIENRVHVDDIAVTVPKILAEARYYNPRCNISCYTERMPTFKLTNAWKNASDLFGGDDNIEIGIKLHFEVMGVVGSFGGNDTKYPDKLADTIEFVSYINSIPTYKGFVDYYLSNDFSLSNRRSKYTRAMYLFGRPLEGYKNEDDKDKAQTKKFYKWFTSSFANFLSEYQTNKNFRIYYFASALIWDIIQAILIQDMLLAIGSLMAVLLWLWYKLGSLYLAFYGLAEIVMSLPTALFLYRCIFQFKSFAGLNAMALFIILAIGADDIFVFYDAWEQSAWQPDLCVSLTKRMDWVYRRAGKAMFITSFTTMCAFIATATSPLVPIKSFGIFTAFCVWTDYVLVMTWFPACLVIYHNYYEKSTFCRCCRKPTPVQERSTSIVSVENEVVDNKKWDFIPLGILKYRFIFISAFLLTLIPSIWATTNIRAATKMQQDLPEDHPLQAITNILNEEFNATVNDDLVTVHLVWGIVDMDRKGIVGIYSPQNPGKLVWDETFRFNDPTQQHIKWACAEARKLSFVARDWNDMSKKKIDCWIDDWETWLSQKNLTFPGTMNSFKMFLDSETKDDNDIPTTMKEKWIDAGVLGLGKSNTIKFTSIRITSTMDARGFQTGKEMKDLYDKFENFKDHINEDGAMTDAPKAFQFAEAAGWAGSKWVWMHTQSIYLSSAIIGATAGVGLGFFVILAATMDIYISCLASFTIASILVTVTGCMFGFGWELGSIESICVTLLAGFSVDYVVHFAHAYREEVSIVSSKERAFAAYKTIGTAVFSGMVTSVLASIPLQLCLLQFFAKFGTFLLLTIGFAWLWANFFFMPMLSLQDFMGGTFCRFRTKTNLFGQIEPISDGEAFLEDGMKTKTYTDGHCSKELLKKEENYHGYELQECL